MMRPLYGVGLMGQWNPAEMILWLGTLKAAFELLKAIVELWNKQPPKRGGRRRKKR